MIGDLTKVLRDYPFIFLSIKTTRKRIKAVITAVGPLEKSNLNARKIDIGGTIAPISTDIKNTFLTFEARSNPMEDGIIKYAKANTSPTNRVVREIPVPTTA